MRVRGTGAFAQHLDHGVELGLAARRTRPVSSSSVRNPGLYFLTVTVIACSIGDEVSAVPGAPPVFEQAGNEPVAVARAAPGTRRVRAHVKHVLHRDRISRLGLVPGPTLGDTRDSGLIVSPLSKPPSPTDGLGQDLQARSGSPSLPRTIFSRSS